MGTTATTLTGAISELNSKITNLIQSETYTATTDASGDLLLPTRFTNHVIVSLKPVRSASGSYSSFYAVNVSANTAGRWYVKCTDDDGINLNSQKVTIIIYYI